MEPLTLAAAAVAAKENAVVKAALEAAGQHIKNSTGTISTNIVDKLVVATQKGFHEYLTHSYSRCRFFKTILPPSQPLEVISNYVNARLKIGDTEIIDDDLVSDLPHAKSVIITGLAGSGKSMLMKYLTVIHFERPNGAIPLFVELRKINSITDRSLMQFIRLSCVSSNKPITESQFSMALASGAFMLILDGFDEIHDEIKNSVQDQILDLRHSYPKATIVVSSRPSDRFVGWSDFAIYKVKELDKEQCVALIESFHYDEGLKKRFVNEVKTKLFSSHGSFLSYPLLVTIMLLTYEEFAQVPTRMHEFYRQAFDTLYQKHDASKEQYNRKTKSALEKDDFQICFSAFCAFSYVEQIFSFKDDRLNDIAEKSVRYLKSTRPDIENVKPSFFVDDLFDAVCMLQKDGLETAFVHRSFQEYFAALFAVRLPSEKMVKVLDRYAVRFSDSPVSMAFAMSPEKVESEWVGPTIDGLLRELDDDALHWVDRYSRAVDGRFGFRRASGSIRLVSYGLHPGVLGPLETVCSLYPSVFKGKKLTDFAKGNEVETLRELFSKTPPTTENGTMLEALVLARESKNKIQMADLTELSPEDETWMRALGIEKLFREIVTNLKKTKQGLKLRNIRRQDLIDDLI